MLFVILWFVLLEERLDVVAMLVSDSELRQSLRSNHLRRLPDLQRLSSRLQRRNASLQDCYRVYQAVGVLPDLVEALETSAAVQQHPGLCAELFTNPIKVQFNFSDFSRHGVTQCQFYKCGSAIWEKYRAGALARTSFHFPLFTV